MLVEDIVLNLLTKHLGTYVADLTHEKLRVGVWSGNVVLTNLELRKDVLDALELPVRLLSGRIGRLQIRVPWTRLRSEPVEISVEDVHLTADLREIPDPGAYDRREGMHKRMRLDAAELLRGWCDSTMAQDSMRADTAPADSFLSRLGRTVLDNLRLRLARVHLRYCHSIDGPSAGFVCGATLEHLEVCSSELVPPAQQHQRARNTPWLHKSLNIIGISLYFDDHPCSLNAASESASMTLTSDVKESAVVLPATDVELRFRVLRTGANIGQADSWNTCNCRVGQVIDIRINDRLVKGLLQLSTHLKRLALRERYTKFRHNSSDLSQRVTPSAWWRFAGRCIQAELATSRRWHGWGHVRVHCSRRREYVPLWQAHLLQEYAHEPPNYSTHARLLSLEDQLSLSDVLLFRALAQSSMGERPKSTAILRSCSEGELWHSGNNPKQTSMDAPSASSVDLLREPGSPRDEHVSVRTPNSSQTQADAATSERGWRGWLWRGSYYATAQPAAAGEPATAERPEGLENRNAGLAQGELSRKQMDNLQSWVHQSGGVGDSVALRVSPSGSAALLQWRVHVSVFALRFQLSLPLITAKKTVGESSAACIFKAHVKDLQAVHRAELLAERSSTRLSISSVDVQRECEDSDGLLNRDSPLLESIHDGAVQVAFSMAHDTWPTTVCSWPEGGSFQNGLQAGYQVTVALLPIRLNVPVPVVRELVDFLTASSLAASVEEVPGPLLQATPQREGLLKLTTGGAQVLVSDTVQDSGECDGIVEFVLEMGEMSMTSQVSALKIHSAVDSLEASAIQARGQNHHALSVSSIAIWLRLTSVHGEKLHPVVLPFALSVTLQQVQRGEALLQNFIHIQLDRVRLLWPAAVSPGNVFSALLPVSTGATKATPTIPPTPASRASNSSQNYIMSVCCNSISLSVAAITVTVVSELQKIELSVSSSQTSAQASCAELQLRLTFVALCANLLPRDHGAPHSMAIFGSMHNGVITCIQGQPFHGQASMDISRGSLEARCIGATSDRHLTVPLLAPSPTEVCKDALSGLHLQCTDVSFKYMDAGNNAVASCSLLLQLAATTAHADSSNKPILLPALVSASWKAAGKAGPQALSASELELNFQALLLSLPCECLMQIVTVSEHSAALLTLVAEEIRAADHAQPARSNENALPFIVRFAVHDATFTLLQPSSVCRPEPSTSTRFGAAESLMFCFRNVRAGCEIREVGYSSGSFEVERFTLSLEQGLGESISRIDLLELALPEAAQATFSGSPPFYWSFCNAPGLLFVQCTVTGLQSSTSCGDISRAMRILASYDRDELILPVPAASDVPFVFEVDLRDVAVVVVNDKEVDIAGVNVHTALQLRYVASGGVDLPPVQRLTLIVPELFVQIMVDHAKAVLLSPCTIVCRYYEMHDRKRGCFQCSDISVQTSYRQIVAISALVNALCAILMQPEVAEPNAQLLSRTDCSVPTSKVLPATSRASSDGAGDSMSECSEYFDAREEVDAAESHVGFSASLQKPTAQAAHARDLQLEAYTGNFCVTLMDDCNCFSTPFVQVCFRLEQAVVRRRIHSAFFVDCRLRGSLYYYKRQQAGAAQGWEAVLLPCELRLLVDLWQRTATLGSRGDLEVDMSASFLVSLLSFQRRVADAESTRQAKVAVPFSSCCLQNQTGTPLHFWVDGERPRALASEGSAAIAEAPTNLPETGRALHVIFEGFLRIDMRPPFRERYRLWPVEVASSSAPVIVYVLLHRHIVHASEVLSLRSPFLLENCCPVPLHVHLHRGVTSHTVRELQVGAETTVTIPLMFQFGWLQADTTPARNEPTLRAGGRLEITTASLQGLKGRRTQAMPCTDQSRALVVTATPEPQPGRAWVVSLHPPFLLHNGLLRALEYELTHYHGTRAYCNFVADVANGTLEQGGCLPIFQRGIIGSVGCYLRVRLAGFQWSNPVLINLAPNTQHDTQDSALAEGKEEYPLRCMPVQSSSRHSSLRWGLAQGMAMRLHVARSARGVSVEVCGWAWVMNDCHLPLSYQVVRNPSSSPVVVQPAELLAGDATAEPLLGVERMLPELLLQVARSSTSAFDSPHGGALVSLSELLRFGASAEDVLLDAPARRASSTAALHISPQPQLLQLAAKLVPLQHRFGSSLLLTISPAYVILNHSSRPLQCCQRGCRTAYTLLPSSSGKDWVPLHWHDPSKKRHILLRRAERGAQWSGGVPVAPSAYEAPLANGDETTLRLQNLETGTVEFLRLSRYRLQGRATTAIRITDEPAESAPIVLHNLTGHAMHFKQVGVPTVGCVSSGQTCPYTWDDPSASQMLHLNILALAIRFRTDCSTTCRVAKPRLAAMLGRARIEMHVRIEGAATHVVLQEIRHQAQVPLLMSRSSLQPQSDSAAALSSHGSKSCSPVGWTPTDVTMGLWRVQLQLPNISLTLIDNTPRELLHLCLRGFRLSLSHQHQTNTSAAQLSVDLAIASVQLDCQLPRKSHREEVLVRAGGTARGDALQLRCSVSHGHSLVVLQNALAVAQEVTLCLDEEALEAVVAALQPSAAEDPHMATTSLPCVPIHTRRCSLTQELGQLEHVDRVPGQRVFVQQLRLRPLKLKVSWQRASRPSPETDQGTNVSTNLHGSTLRWLRWLSITLIGLQEVPVWLPEVVLQRTHLPASRLLHEVQQRYGHALLQQAYKLLPSAAVFGDPYGLLRTLRQGWLVHRQEMRRTKWHQVPWVIAKGMGHLLRASTSNMLFAAARGASALSTGLEMFLSEDSRTGKRSSGDVAMADAIVQGIGGLARETAKTLEVLLHQAHNVLRFHPAMDGPLATLLMPIGFARGLQRLAVLLVLGSLGLMRSTADACRSVVHQQHIPTKEAPGRARAPRCLEAHGLLYPYPKTCLSREHGPLAPLLDGILMQGKKREQLLYYLELPCSKKIVLLTPTRFLCVQSSAPYHCTGRFLVNLLLVQKVCDRLILLWLSHKAVSQVTGTEMESSVTEVQELQTRSEDDVAQLMELLRLTTLNAKGIAISPVVPTSTYRSVVLSALRSI